MSGFCLPEPFEQIKVLKQQKRQLQEQNKFPKSKNICINLEINLKKKYLKHVAKIWKPATDRMTYASFRVAVKRTALPKEKPQYLKNYYVSVLVGPSRTFNNIESPTYFLIQLMMRAYTRGHSWEKPLMLLHS